MLKSYIKITFRNIIKEKGYSFINIIGLAIGMACCIFLLLWVQDELSFDGFHKNAKLLYRVEKEQGSSQGNFHVWDTPMPMAPVIKDEIPEIKNSTRFSYGTGSMLLRYGEKAFFENGIRAVDPSFLNMFTFPFIKGNMETVFKEPHSIILTEEIAEKYFGNEDPLGKIFTLNNSYLFTVTGVLKKIPDNSTLRFDILIPFDFIRELGLYNDTWGWNNTETWVELNDNALTAGVNEKVTHLVINRIFQQIPPNTPLEEINRYREFTGKLKFMLMPLTDIRLYGYFGYGQVTGSIQSVYIFTALAVFILLIACINFMNLSTARSANRSKEIGLRKVVGASRKQILFQFYGESFITTFIAFIFSVIIVLSLLSEFNDISGKKISTNVLFNWEFAAGLSGIAFLTAIISGSYPALFLSSFRPIRVLKGKLFFNPKSGFFRKFLVVTQFSLSIILLIGTIVITQQLQFMRNKKLGYDKEQLLYIRLRGDTPKSYQIFKNEALKDSRIIGVSASSRYPFSGGSNTMNINWDGKDPNRSVLVCVGYIDFDYIETMKIEMSEGRPFSKAFSTDTSNAFLVNEEIVKNMGVKSAVGKRLQFQGVEGTIIGVMKNFHFQSVRDNILPIVFLASQKRVSYAIVRLQAGNISSSLEYLKASWQKVFPNYPFDYRFFDEDFERLFRTDERLSALIKYATILAIFIACLGLFGLASFMAEKRTKEIGIRKALGASVSGITIMLSKEFVQWVAVANLIAGPVAYLLVKKLLQDYAYRVPVEWWVFGLAIASSLLIAILTISWKTIEAARENPVKSLKYE